MPVGEFIEMRQQLRQALEKIAALEAKPAAPQKTEATPAPAPPATEQEQISRKLQDIERRERIRDLVSELGLADQKQGQLVLDILSKNTDLAPPEALELAAKRSPDVFKERTGGGFDPRIHGSLRPTPGSQPEPKKPDKQLRAEHIKKLRADGHKQQADEYVTDIMGAAGAEALGWEYKKLPLPNQQ